MKNMLIPAGALLLLIGAAGYLSLRHSRADHGETPYTSPPSTDYRTTSHPTRSVSQEGHHNLTAAKVPQISYSSVRPGGETADEHHHVDAHHDQHLNLGRSDAPLRKPSPTSHHHSEAGHEHERHGEAHHRHEHHHGEAHHGHEHHHGEAHHGHEHHHGEAGHGHEHHHGEAHHGHEHHHGEAHHGHEHHHGEAGHGHKHPDELHHHRERLEHFIQAIEHLHHAGKADLARELEREAHEWDRDLSRAQQAREQEHRLQHEHEQEHHAQHAQQARRHQQELKRQFTELHQVVGELHQQIQQLKKEQHEMKTQIPKAIEGMIQHHIRSHHTNRESSKEATSPRKQPVPSKKTEPSKKMPNANKKDRRSQTDEASLSPARSHRLIPSQVTITQLPDVAVSSSSSEVSNRALPPLDAGALLTRE